MKTSRYSWVVGILGLTILVVAGIDRRASAQADKPRLMLNTGGPVGGIRALEFSADSSQLYAAGAGKVVNVWKVSVENGGPRAIPADPLRWEIARGMRGRIYTLDVADETDMLAIGGFSARGSTGDIVLFDPAKQRIQHLLPRVRPDVAAPGAEQGHMQTVVSLNLSPSGRQMISMSLDGEVRLWRERGVDSVVLQRAHEIIDGRIQQVAFLDENRVIYPQADQAQPQAWRIVVADTADPNRNQSVLPLPNFWYGIAATAVTTDRRQLAVADHLGEVTLFTTGQRLTPRPLNRPRPSADGRYLKTVASIAFGPDGLLAISTMADAGGACWLELWETSVNPPQLVTERRLGRGNAAFATAFSRNGKLLAVTHADRPSVMLIPVPDGQRQPDFNRAVDLEGRGIQPGRVAFVGTEGYRIAFGPESAPERMLFDLQELKLSTGAAPTESRPADTSGWRVIPQAVGDDGNQQLDLLAPGAVGPQCTIILDTPQQGDYLSHTWLTDAQGTPYGVAVATRRMDGIFLYELSRNGSCRLLRYLRDHSDTLTGMSVSQDGKYLVSSSDDQTIKVWSLAGLRGVNGTFSREDAWGATFGIENGRVVVKTALGAGIAVHRDLEVGDVITRAVYPESGHIVTANDPTQILRALASVPLWQTFQLSTTRNGQAQPDIIVTPAWEPLATLFVDQNDEWAMWTPQGVYDASAGGDELFGWQINMARDQDPQYFRAEKFRGELEKPDVMRQLFAAGSLQEAVRLVGVAQARPIETIARQIPQMQILSPRLGDHFAVGEPINVQAVVTYAEGTGPADFRVRLFVNQIDGGQPRVRQVNNDFLYSWTAAPAGGQNQLLVRVEETSGAVDAMFQDATVQVSADVAPGRMRLHVFALAAENYSGLLHQPFCNDDAIGLTKLLETHDGRQYDLGQVELLTDENGTSSVTKDNVATRVDAFRGKLDDVSQDDLLVVFVAGHGRAYGADYFFIPPASELGDAPDEAVIRKVGVSWDTLRQLAEVPCRKVFLLDTCFSGNVALAEKNSIRPLRQMQAMIFAATSENQEAFGQHPDRENGLFTGYFIDACTGMADGVDSYEPVNPKFSPSRDGQINLLEVVSYVSFNVREFNRFQRPKYTPIQLLNFVDLPLFQVLQQTTQSIGSIPQLLAPEPETTQSEKL